VRVESSTTLAAASNQLLVSFVANFNILKEERIYLRGLHGSGTPDKPIDIESLPIDIVSSPGTWVKEDGTVVFDLTSNVKAFTLITLVFTLINPALSQPAQMVALHCDSCCANAQALSVASAVQLDAVLGVQFATPTCAHVNITSVLQLLHPANIIQLQPTGVYGPACDALCYGLGNRIHT